MALDRRRFLVAAGVAALGAAALRADGAAGRRPRGSDRSMEPGELTILSGLDESVGRQRHRLVRDWSECHPDNPARIIEVAGVTDAQRSEMVARAQSRDPSVDIFNLDVTWTAEFAEADYIRPLAATGVDFDAFLDPPMETCRYGNELWALPFNSDAGLLFFRTDLIPEAPDVVDWGWIDAQMKELLPDPSGQLQAGYAAQLADYEGLTVNALERIWAAAQEEVIRGDWRDPTIELDSTSVAAALYELGRVFDEEEQQLILPQSAEFDETATTQAFRERRVVFMRNWPVAFRSLQPPTNGDSPGPEGPIDVRRLPGHSVLGGQNLAIARHSPRPVAAQRLIEFLACHDSQLILFRDGGLPATRHAVYWDPGVTKRHAYAETLEEAIRFAWRRPETPYYPRFSEVFRRGVRQAMRDRDGEGRLSDGFADQLAKAMRGVRQ
jgi:multiple sugar transport system substrate-binding protein